MKNLKIKICDAFTRAVGKGTPRNAFIPARKKVRAGGSLGRPLR